MDLTPEENIILLTSRLHPSTAAMVKTEDFFVRFNRAMDYDRLVALAAGNGVAALVYQNIKHIPVIPGNVISALRKIYLRTIAENLKKSKELLVILQTLASHGIDAIPIKGVSASELIFENPGLYYGSDIDILVGRADLALTKHLLIEAGYVYDEKQEKAMLASHYHLVFYNSRNLIEVHWNLVKRYFDIPPEFWRENTVKQKYENTDVLFLSPEKYLMYTVFRLFSHTFFPLKFFLLISEISNKYYEHIDWDQFEASVKKYKMWRLTTFVFKLLNEFLGTKVHDRFMDNHIIGYDCLKTAILKKLFREVKRPYLNKIPYVFLLDSPHDILDLLFRRLWPEIGELRLRYGISEDSKLLYVYYLLNPVLLPLLLARKGKGRKVNSKK